MTNPLRKMMTTNVIHQNPDVPLTVEALRPFFPDDFDLGEDDLAPHVQAAAGIEFEGELPPTPKVLSDAEVAALNVAPDPQGPSDGTSSLSDAFQSAAGIEPEIVPPTPEEIEAAVQRRIQADQDLANRRSELLSAQSVERAARDKLSQAVSAFQKGFAPITPEQLRRSHVQEEAAIRQAIKDGTMPAPRNGAGVGKSVVDRQAFYSRGGSPGRGDYRRGAFPSQAQGAKNYDPRKGNVAKLPSQA